MSTQKSFVDQLIASIDSVRKTLLVDSNSASRPNPAEYEEVTAALSPEEMKHVAGLMRINHSGEVCAQALYQGQALTAKSVEVKNAMQVAAAEEEDHLAWCQERLNDFNSQPSIFNPVWYGLSFALGAAAGAVSDKLSLGFVAATEEQVCKHLRDHLSQLPESDVKTRAILEQMEKDEAMHATKALESGGIDFPKPVKAAMSLVAKVMTTLSYRL